MADISVPLSRSAAGADAVPVFAALVAVDDLIAHLVGGDRFHHVVQYGVASGWHIDGMMIR